MGMEFLTFLALGSLVDTELLSSAWNKIELLKNILVFIGELPDRINYPKHLGERVQTLKRKKAALCSIEEDVYEQLEIQELQPGKRRKRQVENWLSNVQSKKNDLQQIELNTGENFLQRVWQQSLIESHILQVDELIHEGRFEGGLVMESPHPGGEALLTAPLMGNTTHESLLQRILEAVMDNEILTIGVHGVQGVGKTCVTLLVHKQLSENDDFKVYWVTVSPVHRIWSVDGIHDLQNEIAKEVGIDFHNENDQRKRAAKLHRALKERNKSVLILDGLSEHFDLDKVGIPRQENGLKLIMTTRSDQVCRRMGCSTILEMEPLPLDDANKLFMEKVGLSEPYSPEIDEIAKQIVEECGGLPASIVEMAVELRGVENIQEWRNALNELIESRNRPQD